MSGHAKSGLITRDQVKLAMEELVLKACEVARKQARTEAKILQLRADLERDTKEARASMAALEADLRLYVQTNPGEFEKPRSLKHAGATVGWEKTSEISFTDPEEMVGAFIEAEIEKANAADDAERADRLGACLKVNTKVLKGAVKEAILAGLQVPGCIHRETDQPFVRLDSKLLKAAVEAEGGAA